MYMYLYHFGILEHFVFSAKFFNFTLEIQQKYFFEKF